MAQDLSTAQDGTWLVDPSSGVFDRRPALQGSVFLGVDFGTATTVVSEIVASETASSFFVRPLTVSQPSAHGGVIRDALVNTVLSYRNEELLFGQDAYNLRPRLTEGRNTFSSFKMGLGLNLGPEYAGTVLPKGRIPGVTIERPADAAREFFKLLRTAIQDELHSPNQPRNVRYAFTVPAAFQANQRRDLLKAIRDCGIEVDEGCLIDEPNAAFLSYIYETARSPSGRDLIVRARQGKVKILVYDFGAGTCDLSLLEFSISGTKVVSRNKAISKFTALGGDDIDRAIARQVLVEQLRDHAGNKVEFTSIDIDEKIVPRLMPAAEKLKVSLSKMIEGREICRMEAARALPDIVFETHPLSAFKLRGMEVTIPQPSLSIQRFITILESFCGDFNPNIPGHHVAAPVHDVLDKASMDSSEIDAVLFIGGSAKNPLVRSAVMDCFPPEVEAVVPKDLRVHVSQGAAIHSLGIHGFGFDFIAPITSETVYVVTRGGGLDTLIPASSPVPTTSPFVINLVVPDDKQPQVDIPICSGVKDRLIGIISIRPRRETHFKKGDPVSVTGFISKEKLLEVTVSVAGQTTKAEILNPMSNGRTSPAELAMLREKQKFNESVLQNNGRPKERVVADYSRAAAQAGAYELAADLLVALERLNPSCDSSTNICYYYSMAGRKRKSKDWAEIAYNRNKSACTAYNLACDSPDAGDRERLLREALQYDPDYPTALRMLSDLLARKDPDESKAVKRRLVSILEAEQQAGEINVEHLKTLAKAAFEIGEHDIAKKARDAISEAECSSTAKDAAYLDEHLAASRIHTAGLLKEHG